MIFVTQLMIPSFPRSDQTDNINKPRQQRQQRSSISSCFGNLRSCLFNWTGMTADQLRWSVQVGVAGGMTSFLCTFLPASTRFFGSPGVIGTAICVSAIDATTGGSLRKTWLLSTFGMAFACLAFGLFAGCSAIAGDLNSYTMIYLVATCTSLLIVPATYIRYAKPSFNVGSNFGVTTAETVLLGTFAAAENHAPFRFAYARAISTVIGAACAGISSQFVMRKAARPTLSITLCKILTTIAEVLEDLALALDLEISTTPFNQRLLTLSSPETTNPSPSFMIAQQQELCLRLAGNIQKTQEMLGKQRALMESAQHEISWKKPHRFPSKEFGALLNEVQNLFFHVASLVFTLNIYITAERNKLSCDKLSPERQTPDSDLAVVTTSQDKTLSLSRFRKKVAPEEVRSPPSTCALFGVYSGDGEPSRAHALIGTVTRHLAGALNGIAECSKDGRVVDVVVKLEIEKASDSIGDMDEKRHNQRLAFGEVVMNTLEAHCKGEWTEKHLDFKAALGVSPSTFLKLNAADQIAYWDAYWLQRDRISTSSVTLMTLKESLLNLCTLTDKYVLANSAAKV